MSNFYKKTEEILTSQKKFHISLGLDRILTILNLLKNPQNNLKIIQIAGTNGKGSVSRMLSEILTLQGYKTALFTSPHIHKYTERVKINNQDISDKDMFEYLEEIDKIAHKNNIELTEFELLTAIAFKYFSDNKVDIAIFETGLGGRFDATNVCNTNLFSVITSISKDHTEKLGKTISKIAFEKAGIIKNKGCVLISKTNAGRKTVQKVAQEKNAQIFYPKTRVKIVFENNTNYAKFNGILHEFSLLGLYQKENLELVLMAIEILSQKGFKISEKILCQALKSVKWECRFEWHKDKNLIIDGAHNPNGAKKFKESLDFYFPNTKKIWIYGTLKNKDYLKITQNLFDKNDEIYYFNFDNRCLTYEEFKKYYPQSFDFLKTEKALQKTDLKIVVGSLYMPDYISSFGTNKLLN